MKDNPDTDLWDLGQLARTMTTTLAGHVLVWQAGRDSLLVMRPHEARELAENLNLQADNALRGVPR